MSLFDYKIIHESNRKIMHMKGLKDQQFVTPTQQSTKITTKDWCCQRWDKPLSSQIRITQNTN